jgi:hypothetical protein
MFDTRVSTCGLLASLLTIGCGEPDCRVDMTLSGAIEGAARIEGSGEDFCAAEPVSGLVILSFSRVVGINDMGVSDLQVNVQAPALAEGTFAATVVVGTASSSFVGEDCSITLANFEREDWTVTDYLNFTAQLSCSAPLEQLQGGFSTLELGPTQIEGHVLYE